MHPIRLERCFDAFDELWSPKIIGQVNDCAIKVVKLEGEFVWHHHDQEDEAFLVIQGRMLMRFPDREVLVESGEILIVPRGLDHQPVASEICHVVLLEPLSTLNTGNVVDDRTVPDPERLSTK